MKTLKFSVYAGTEPSRLFRIRDGGQSWEELVALQEIPSRPDWSFPPRPWTSHARWIAPSPHDPEVVLVGIELGGLMRTDDGGASFSDHRPGAARDVHCLAWHASAPGRAYEAGGDGAAWSHDGGGSWDQAEAGRDRRYAWALAVDSENPDRWFVSAAPGPFQAHGRGPSDSAIYRWEGSGPWQVIEGPLDSHVYALVTGQGQLFAGLPYTADGGRPTARAGQPSVCLSPDLVARDDRCSSRAGARVREAPALALGRQQPRGALLTARSRCGRLVD